MSEYQYYEFQALDRPLTEQQIRELRRLSTRAEITPTKFVNTYHWGDFRGNPHHLMEKYFDTFVYFANWGTKRFMVRLPKSLIDVATLKRYSAGDSFNVKVKGNNVLVDFFSNDEEGFWEGNRIGSPG